ncbi:MAG TPA: hypothetical protein DCS07_09540 [Bdellovibrionales bacterium]|nr:MAG: hypothetical protein A2X97_02865 [Bdellovibrionales bacterium GWA1_52_35]OFZ39972.1 MAG: hypothetical protein A2070_07980 [Bdellovibrionales bacterium GWC1_52_8]HAR42854.1 hypothetical protein [Bdellovibrionales bacterium]HCM40134.1 hypothetical protein [Bdellovibrionales bacterium]
MKQKMLSGFCSIGLIFSIFNASNASAASAIGGQSVFVAGQLGVGFSNNQQGSDLSYGGTVGMRLTPTASAGVFVDRITLGSITSAAVTLNNSSQSMTFFGGEATVLMGELMEGLELGAKAGLVSSYIEAAAPGIYNDSKRNMNLFIGPKAGYEIPVAERLAAGGELNLLFKTTSDEPISGYSTVNGVSTIVNVLGTLKYFF